MMLSALRGRLIVLPVRDARHLDARLGERFARRIEALLESRKRREKRRRF
jgi:hypothetical protein